MGGHCRVGLEDNIYHDFGRNTLATNIGLVERLALLVDSYGRRMATPNRARAMLGLAPSPARVERRVLEEVAG
jgi:uncharacterized protein (DUF849 family)